MIGDPSGRTDMRRMLTREDIDHNAECFKRQMERFIEFGEGKAMMLNNADWLLKLNYIDLLREVGACFSVNNMLRAECYKQRMEKGLSFLEFNYMIMQSYDFYYLYQNYGIKKALASKAKSFDARAMLHRGTTLLVFSQRKSNSNRITDGPPQPTLFHFGAELRKVFAREGALRLSSAGHFLLRTSHTTYFRQCFYIYYYTHFGLLCQAPSQIWELCQNNRLI